MVHNYAIPVSQGLVIFIALAALLWLPYMIWLYRRYGRVSPRRVIAQGAFLLYLICAWALVLLPFPDPSLARRPAPVNLIPFLWWQETLHELARTQGGWRVWLTNGPLLVRIFNVALTVPFGVFLRRWYRRGFWVTTVAGFGLSLAFELTQLTGSWGIYAVRYRTFDVDDLIANTAGAALGWALAPLVFLLPARQHHDDHRDFGSPSAGRRLIALAVDSICWVLAYLVTLFVSLVALAALDVEPRLLALVWWTLTFVGVFVVVPAVADGATPGKALVRLAVRRSDGTPSSWWRYLLREAVILWPVVVIPAIGEWGDAILPDEPGWTLAAVFGVPLAWLLLLGLVALLRSDRRSVPDLLAGTRVEVDADLHSSGSTGSPGKES
jgi:glycopeptide antibiotics resistance protein/uncharacterized RDD family membrane protein YckC